MAGKKGAPKKPAGSGNRTLTFPGQSATRPASGAASYGSSPYTSSGSRPTAAAATDWSFLSAPSTATYEGGTSYGAGTSGYDYSTDPTYQAYINALDLEAAQRQAMTQQRRAYLEADRDTMLGETARDAEQSRTNVSGNYEDRGLFLSGAHEGDLARNRQNELSRVGRIQTEAGRGISDLEAALAQALASINLRKQQASLGIYE